MSIGPLLAAAALALAPAGPQVHSVPYQPPADEKGSAQAGPAGREVTWARTWDEALATAKKADHRLLIEFFEPGCGDCKRVEQLVVPATAFYAFTRDKVPVRIDRSTPDGKKLARRFGIRDLPAWVIATPDMLLCGIQVGSTNQAGLFDTFARTEQSWIEYQKKLAKEAQEPDNEDLAFDVAQETYKRGGDELAEPRFQKLASTAKKRDLREKSLAYLASLELDSGRIDEAGQHLDELAANAQDKTLKERAELRRADVDIARGRRDLATVRLETFKKLHPQSPLVKEADALLAALRAKGVNAVN